MSILSDTQRKALLKKWEEKHRNFQADVLAQQGETPEQKAARIAQLEADDEAWFKYYLPHYASHEAAWFQKASTKRIMQHSRWYEVRAWSRDFAKTTRAQMEILKLALTGKIKNTLCISNSLDNAELLLLPVRIILETNPRILADYGEQRNPVNWTSIYFVTLKGVSFKAIGAGQSPRGAKNEAYRPDMIWIDDIDTDEEVRNPQRIKDKWAWIEKAVIPVVDLAKNYRFLFCGNIIGKDTCITRAIEKADHVDIINLVDEDGNSNWKEKISGKDVEDIRKRMSYIAFQQEYMNNPLSVGTVFAEMLYKKMLPVSKYEMLVCYTDPSFKDSKKNDYKATVLVGKYRNEFHVIKAYVEQTTTARMVEWHYDIMQFVGEASCYYYMESNMLQDTIFQEFQKQAADKGKVIPVRGDDRKKPDKFTRIESLLEPLNRNGQLWLNEAEEKNPSMRTLDEQFKALEPGSRAHDDAPDAVEGAVWMLNNKLRKTAIPTIGNKMQNSKRF